MNKAELKARLQAAWNYLWARLGEPSTWKGMILICAAAGWWDLDNTSKGEALAQGGLFLYGIVNAFASDNLLYRKGSNGASGS